MSRDYYEIVRALRAKADDKAATPEEKETLRAKAKELEDKYCIRTSPIGDDTTVTSRDGRGPFERPPNWHRPNFNDEYWTLYMTNLLDRQWMWNNHFNPEADVDNIYEEDYKYEEEDDDE